MPAVAAFHFDAAARPFLDELIDAGDLPAIARIRGGVRGSLDGERPYCAEVLPTGFLTGRTPGQNRYWGTVVFDPSTYRCRTIGSAELRPFYAQDGAPSAIAFDLPHSVIDERVRGIQVVSWGGHDGRFQYGRSARPAGLLAEIDRRFGRDPSLPVEYRGAWWDADHVTVFADALVASAARRAAITLWLLEQAPETELLLTAFPEPHAAGHVMGQAIGAGHPLSDHPTAAVARTQLRRVYKAIDAAVGTIVARLPDDVVSCVYSVRGMEATVADLASSVLVPELLYRLATGRRLLDEPGADSWRRAGCPPIDPGPGVRFRPWLRARYLKGASSGPVGSSASLVRRVARRAGAAVSHRPGPEDAAEQPDTPVRGDADDQVASWYRRHWPRMRAFVVPSFSDVHVRLNVEGRERHGVIARDDYARACDEVEVDLRRAIDVRTGTPLVEAVHRVREQDPLAEPGPSADLVVTVRVPSDAIDHPTGGTIGPFPFPRSGSHTERGFAYLAGPGLSKGDARPMSPLELPAQLLHHVRKASAEPIA